MFSWFQNLEVVSLSAGYAKDKIKYKVIQYHESIIIVSSSAVLLSGNHV